MSVQHSNNIIQGFTIYMIKLKSSSVRVMDKRMILFAAIALVAGILIPIIGLYLAPGQTGTGEATPSIIVPSPAPGTSPAVMIPQPINATQLQGFNSYTALITYLKSIENLEETLGTNPLSTVRTLYTAIPIHQIENTIKTLHAETTQEYSTTNVQVEGIDEPDIVKTNGKIIAVVNNDKVYVVDAKQEKVLSVIKFNRTIRGIFLDQNILVVITGNQGVIRPLTKIISVGSFNGEQTIIKLINVTEPEHPYLLQTYNITGRLISARLYRGILYVVTSQPVEPVEIPLINGVPFPIDRILLAYNPPDCYTNIFAVNMTSLKYNVLSIMTGSASKMYMSYKHLVVVSPASNIYLITIKHVLEATLPMLPTSLSEKISELLEKNTYYTIMTAYNLFKQYVESLPQSEANELVLTINKLVNQESFTAKSRFYVFAINGLSIKYKGSFEVKGYLQNQFCMEEYKDNYFIAATNYVEYTPVINIYAYKIGGVGKNIGITITLPNGEKETYTHRISSTKYPGIIRDVWIWTKVRKGSNALTIADLENLKTVSRLDDIAVGETIKTGRLINDIYILITYRRVDPLFAINVSDPYHPEIIGYLRIPGYNVYLHPLGHDILLGIGVDNGNLTISLYNISDPKHVSRLSRASIGKLVTSPVLYDYHALTLVPEKKVFIIPLSHGWAWSSGSTTNTGVWGYGCFGFLIMSYANDELGLVKIVELNGGGRSLYIGDKLYLVSPNDILILSLENFEEIGNIKLG